MLSRESTGKPYRNANDSFEWDDRKARRNIADHGVSFELARFAFDDPRAFEKLDLDENDEERCLLTGLADGRMLTVCHTERSHRIRIISAW